MASAEQARGLGEEEVTVGGMPQRENMQIILPATAPRENS